MKNSDISSAPEAPPPAETPPEVTSFWAKLTNVFAYPGDVFAEVAASPTRLVNWLVPTILAAVVGLAYVLIVFSQEPIMRQILDQQAQALQKQVDAGKLSQRDADQATQRMEPFVRVMVRVGGSVSALVASVGWVFFLSLLAWLVGRYALKGRFTYMKTVEVVALAGLITILGTLLAIPLAVSQGSLHATPGPALLVSEFDPKNTLHLALSSINVFLIWYLVVLAIGLSKLSRASLVKCLLWVLLPWAIIHGTILVVRAHFTA